MQFITSHKENKTKMLGTFIQKIMYAKNIMKTSKYSTRVVITITTKTNKKNKVACDEINICI